MTEWPPPAWHEIQELRKRTPVTHHVGDRVQVHALTSVRGPTGLDLKHVTAEGVVIDADHSWPRYTIKLDSGYIGTFPGYGIDSTTTQDSLF